MEKTLSVGTVQFCHINGDVAANLAIIDHFAAQGAQQGLELIIFPECCLTGYWFLRHLDRQAIDDLAEAVPDGPSCRHIRELSRQYGMTIGAGLIERDTDGTLYNSYLVAMADGTWACHRKLHCFVSEHMASGDAVTVFDSPHGAKLGVLICYDNNLIENVRLTALAGADILLAPHQTGGCASRKNPHQMGAIDPALWQGRHENPAAIEAEFAGDKGKGWLMRWLPSRAHDNGMFVLFSNGVGLDDDEVRTGNAMILDPYGRILAQTGKADDVLVTTKLDPSLRQHNTGRGWIRSRRPELYGPLTKSTGLETDTRHIKFETI